jgi:hypothetical protein
VAIGKTPYPSCITAAFSRILRDATGRGHPLPYGGSIPARPCDRARDISGGLTYRECIALRSEAEILIEPRNAAGRVVASITETSAGAITAPELRREAISLLQSVIGRVVITTLVDGFDIDVHGEIGTILNIVDQKSKCPGTAVSGRSLKLVAGARFAQEPTIEVNV